MTSKKIIQQEESSERVELTVGMLINKLDRDLLDTQIKKVRKFLKRSVNREYIKQIRRVIPTFFSKKFVDSFLVLRNWIKDRSRVLSSFETMEVNTFLFFKCNFPVKLVELPEQRKELVGKLELILQKYGQKEGDNYARKIRQNIEIRDIMKLLISLVKNSTTPNKEMLVNEIKERAKQIDIREVQHVLDVHLNSYVAIWDFPPSYPDIIMLPDLILKREVFDKTQNIPLSFIAENLLIIQFAKACVSNLNPILASNEQAIQQLSNIFLNPKEFQYLEQIMTLRLWKTLRVVFGLLSSAQQVNNIVLKQIKRIAEVRRDLGEDVQRLQYGTLEDFLMFSDTILACDQKVTQINELQLKVKQNYQALLMIINKFQNPEDRLLEDIQDLSLLFTQVLTEIQLMKFYSDKFKDLAYFQTIPQEVAFEDKESIVADSDVILKGIALFKTYRLVGSTVYALRGIDIEIKKGEMAAIVGPSGSGKTTLLNLLSGLDTPNRGAVFLLGKNIETMSDIELSMFRRRNMGFIFQYYNLVPQLTVLENVMLPGLMIGRSNREVKEQAMKLLQEIGLERFKDQFPIKLSGGQMQRVTIARAMINNPSILFADEPTGDLDSHTGQIVIDLIRRFSKMLGTAVVLVTHDLEMAKTCDRMIEIGDGKVITR